MTRILATLALIAVVALFPLMLVDAMVLEQEIAAQQKGIIYLTPSHVSARFLCTGQG